MPWSAQVSQRNGDDEGDHVLRPERGRDQRVVAVQPVRGEDTARRHRRHDDREAWLAILSHGVDVLPGHVLSVPERPSAVAFWHSLEG